MRKSIMFAALLSAMTSMGSAAEAKLAANGHSLNGINLGNGLRLSNGLKLPNGLALNAATLNRKAAPATAKRTSLNVVYVETSRRP